MPDIQDLLAAADALTVELHRLRGRFEALGAAHGCEWADRERDGYPAGAAVPRYRDIPCAAWGELASPAGATEVALLPTAHLDRGDHTLIRSGIAHAREWPASEGLRPQGDALLRDIDAQRHVLYQRGLPAGRAGWRVARAWEAIPLSSLVQMLEEIRAYGEAMHQDALRRQSPCP